MLHSYVDLLIEKLSRNRIRWHNQGWFAFLYTAISRKVVGEKCARDNPER